MVGATEAVIELGPGWATADVAEVLGILSSTDWTIGKGAVAGVTTWGVATAGVTDWVIVAGAPEVTSTTGTVDGAAAVAAGETTGAVDVVVGAVTGVVADVVAGVAAWGVAGDASTPDCSAEGVRVDTNSDALGFNEAELGLTEATAVGAAIWRMAEIFHVLLANRTHTQKK